MLPLCGQPSACHLKWLDGSSLQLCTVLNRDFHTSLFFGLYMNRRVVYDVEVTVVYHTLTVFTFKKKLFPTCRFFFFVNTGQMRPHRLLSCGRQSIKSLGFFSPPLCALSGSASTVVLRRPGTQELRVVTQMHVQIERAWNVTAGCERYNDPLWQHYMEIKNNPVVKKKEKR